MYASTPSTSSPTLRTGRRSDTGRLIFGLASFAGREFAATLLVLVGASLLLFLVLKAAPADTERSLRLQRGVITPQEEIAQGEGVAPDGTGSEYFSWLSGVVTGDFGKSTSLQRGRPAGELIWPAAKSSFSLLFIGMFFSVLIAVMAAVLRTAFSQSALAKIPSIFIGLFSAIPVFLYVYAVVAGGNRLILWGVDGGMWSIPHWFPLPAEPALLPWLLAAVILAVGDGGLVDLYQRFSSEMRHSYEGEHIAGVKMLGLSVPEVVARGFFPGALSHIARRISFFLGSLVVVESALGWPGLGYLAWRAAAERDIPVLLGAAIVMAAVLRVVQMLCDFLGYLSDPRRRVG